MLASLKVSVRDTLIYGIGNIAVKVVGLLLIPLYTSPEYFSVDDFGALGMLEITGLVLTAILASSLPQSLTRYFWDKSAAADQKGLFFMTITTQVAVSFILCALLIPLSASFSEILFKKSDMKDVITLVIISSGLQAINNIVNTLMRLQSRAILYISANIFKLLFVLFLTIWLIAGRNEGLEGIYMAQAAGNILFLLILAGYTIKNSSPRFNTSLFREMNVYGYPLLLANISAVALNVIDRFALNSMALLKYVAVYTLAFKVTSVLKIVLVDSIKLAIGPVMFKKADQPDAKRFYSKMLLYTSFALMISIIFISLFSYELINAITRTDELASAVYIIPLLGLSIFFVNMKEITVYGLHIVRKTKIIGSVVVLTTLASLGLNILLIPLWDVYGCALATFISQLIYFMLVFLFSQKKYHVPYEYYKLILLFTLGTLFSFSAFLLNDLDLVPRIGLKLLVFALFPFVLYPLGFYEKVELDTIKGLIRKWGNISNLGDNLRTLRNIGD